MDKVPTLSIILMTVDLFLSLAVPVLMFFVLRRRRGCDQTPFFIGMATMLLFAFTLEPLVHSIVLTSPLGTAIKANIWLTGLYGGLTAGLFEETGRYIAFSTVLRKYSSRDDNALMYGAGHAGMELIYIMGLSMVSNLIMALAINGGHTSSILSGLTGDGLASAQAAIDQLITTPSYMFLVSLAERAAAVVAQLALSVMVWYAVKDRRRFILYPAAIAAHMVLDATAVILSSLAGLWVSEASAWIIALLLAWLACRLRRQAAH